MLTHHPRYQSCQSQDIERAAALLCDTFDVITPERGMTLECYVSAGGAPMGTLSYITDRPEHKMPHRVPNMMTDQTESVTAQIDFFASSDRL